MAVGCEGHGIVGPANRPTTGCPFTIFLPFSHSHSPFAHHDGRRRCKMAQCAITVHSFIHIPLRGHSSLTHSASPLTLFPRCPFYLFFLLSVRPLPFFSAYVPGGWPWLWPIQCCCQPTLRSPFHVRPILFSLCLSLFMLTGQYPLPIQYISLLFPHSPTPISSQFSAPIDGRPSGKKTPKQQRNT